MTADAFCVISVDVAAHGGIRFLDAENGILRTINDAVVALEAHAATHAAVGFLFGVFFRESLDPLAEGP